MSSVTRFPWVLTLLTLALLVLMVRLGFWQLGRADESRGRLTAYSSASAARADLSVAPERYSLVEVTGRYDSTRQVLMDGFSVNKRAGYQVLTPFVVEGTDTVLMVNRGWRAWIGQRDRIEGLEIGNELRTLRGRAERFWAPGMVLGEGNAGEKSAWPRIVVYPQHKEIRSWMQQSVAVWQLLLSTEESEGFVREWRPGGLPPERHVGYAVQWFALSITLLVLYLVLLFKRKRVSSEEHT